MVKLNSNKILFFWASILLLLDAISKHLVFYYLETKEICLIPNFIYLKKVVKDLPFIDAVLANKSLEQATLAELSENFFISYTYFILLIYFFFTRDWKPKYFFKYLIAFIFYIFFSYCVYADVLVINTGIIATHQKVSTILILVNYIICPVLLFTLFENTYSKFIIMLMFIGSLGNVLSFLYPPYTVVDFLYLPSKGMYYDLADIYLIIKSLLIIISPFFLIYYSRKIYKSKNV